jgi:hypothetical protein
MCQKPQALTPSLVKIVSGQWKIASNGKKNSKMLFRLVCRNIFGTDCRDATIFALQHHYDKTYVDLYFCKNVPWSIRP